jgi:K+-transporting ATPase ATPase C chain
MLKEIRPAIVMIVLLTIVTGLVYPLAMTGIAQALFPRQANGSLIVKDGKVLGSELIGQNFTEDRYFQGRPSATSAPDPNDATKTVPAPYNAANSSASNAGPTSKALIERIQGDAEKLKKENPNAPVPVDLARGQGARFAGGPGAGARHPEHRGPLPRRTGRAPSQRPAAQHGPRRSQIVVTRWSFDG